MAQSYFVAHPDGGFGPAPGFKPAPGAQLVGGQFYDKYVDANGQVYSTYTDKGPLSAAPWAGNGPGTYLAPDGQAPGADVLTSGQFRDTSKPGVGQSITDTLGPAYNPSAGPQVNAGNGPEPILGMNPSGQGFFTATSTQNQINSVRDYLAKLSTSPNDPGVPTRDNTSSSPSSSSSSGSGSTGQTDYEKLIASLGAAPTAPNFAQRETELATQYGLDGLNASLTDINSKIAALGNDVAAKEGAITGSPTSSVFRGRADSALSKSTKVQLDALTAQQKTITTQISNAQKAISTALNLEKTDYQTAVKNYNDAFSQNMKILTANNSAANKEQTQALANFKYLMDTYSKHNLSYSDLSDVEKSNLQSIAQQTGSGAELLAFMEAQPKQTITDKTTNGNVTTITSKDQSGNTKVTNIVNNSAATTKPYTSGALSIPRSDLADGQQRLEASRGPDGFANTKLYTDMQNTWMHAGGLLQDFLRQYPPKNYLNPNDPTVPSYLLK